MFPYLCDTVSLCSLNECSRVGKENVNSSRNQFSFKVKASDFLVYLNKISFSKMSGFSAVRNGELSASRRHWQMREGCTGRSGKLLGPDFSLMSLVRAGRCNRAGESWSLGNHIPHRDCPERRKKSSRSTGVFWNVI